MGMGYAVTQHLYYIKHCCEFVAVSGAEPGRQVPLS